VSGFRATGGESPRRHPSWGARLAFPALLLLLVLACVLACAKKTEPRVVRFWQFWNRDLLAPMIADFEKQHPGIRVEMETLTWASGFEKIVVAIASESGPDLVELGSTWVPKFASEGALRDVTAEAAPLRPSLVQWESGTIGEAVYAIPWLVGTRVLFVNLDLLAAGGADTTAPATWPDLLAACRAAHAPGRDAYGFGMNAGERHVLYKKFLPFVWSNGGDVLAPDGRPNLESPECLEALEFYRSLVPYSLLERQDQLDQGFLDGRLAVTLSGGWLDKRLRDKGVSFRWRIAPLPRPRADSPPSASFAGAEMLAVPRDAKHPDEALLLARYLVDGSRALAIADKEKSVLPAATDAAVMSYYDAHPEERVYLDVLRDAKAPPAHPAWVDMQEALNTAIEEVLFGRAEPREAMARADAAIGAVLARR
jgi:multiple sugar transport system substrate-binding protein